MWHHYVHAKEEVLGSRRWQNRIFASCFSATDTMSSSAPPDGLTAQQYLSQERFRRVCPVNGASYCDIGSSAPSDVLVMLCASAMDSILTSAVFDDFCTDKGIRLICVDKPGMGQTPSCPLADRVATHTSTYREILLGKSRSC